MSQIKSFAELELLEPIRQALKLEQYTNPTPVQAQSIPKLLEGHDLLGCAQTGTGKTAAFALPILQHLAKSLGDPIPHEPRVLVLGPTRELVAQITDSFRTYGRFLEVAVTSVFGGVSMQNQIRAMRKGAHVVVATPGRLLDLMGQDEVDLSHLEFFVLDEADRMLDMGFLPDVKRIIARLPKRRQSAFFSATLPPPVVALAQSLLRNPLRVNITPPSTTVSAIDQHVIHVGRTQRLPLLLRLCEDQEVVRMIVFTRTKRNADQVAKKLTQGGIGAFAIHGNKTQATRERVLKGFRDGKFTVLVATDLAARGIDVDNVSHVVNYDLPEEPESYVHRIGRTGRAGATGVAWAFCGPEDIDKLKLIEKTIGKRVPILNVKFDLPPPEPASPAKPQQARTPQAKPMAKDQAEGHSRHSNSQHASSQRSHTAAQGTRAEGSRDGMVGRKRRRRGSKKKPLASAGSGSSTGRLQRTQRPAAQKSSAQGDARRSQPAPARAADGGERSRSVDGAAAVPPKRKPGIGKQHRRTRGRKF